MSGYFKYFCDLFVAGVLHFRLKKSIFVVSDFHFHLDRRAELELKIRRRVALEEKAHRIVERLLNNPIQPDFMIDCVSIQPT